MTDTATAVEQDAALTMTPGARGLGTRLLSLPPWVGGVIGAVILIALWQIVSVATAFGKTGAIPQPMAVVKLFIQVVPTSTFWDAVFATTGAAAEGYVIGNVIALLLAALVLLVPRSEGISTQLAVVTSCIPLTAIGPLIAVMSDAGSRLTSVVLAAMSVVFTTTVGTILGLKSASPTQLDVVSAYGGSRLTQITKVRLISAAPALLAALKIAAPAAFLGAVLGEYFLVGVDTGLGIVLLNAQFNNSAVVVWVIAFTSAAIAGAAYFVIDRIGRLLTPWSRGTEGQQS